MSREDITLEDGWFIGEDQPFAYVVSDDASTPRPIDITGLTILFEMSATFSGDSLFITPVTVTNGPGGLIEWIVASGDTIGLAGDETYWYTVRIVTPGSRTELAWGTIELNDVFVNY